eukprot:CCRYP_002530-RA/>CCRYP_002530-RA protein AED:0.10 eAED:0.10 QI:89/1/1/1/0.83/0.85/7/208/1057
MAAPHKTIHDSADYAVQVTPLSCAREPIHIVNRIQPCGTLLVVDADLRIVQCSTNAVEFLPADFDVAGLRGDDAASEEKLVQLLDAIIGSPLSLLLQADAVDKVRAVVLGAPGVPDVMGDTGDPASAMSSPGEVQAAALIGTNTNSGAVRTFLVRTQGSLSLGRRSCMVTQSGEHFLLEIEEQEQPHEDREKASPEDQEDTMLFMQSIAHELRKCWSIEEMAALVCSRIMTETPYDRGMVYRFDPADDSGEVIYETTRWDARQCCRDDSFLGLRFPASDIPRQARELFMKNTLRFVYDVDGKDYPLYPSKIKIDVLDGEEKYTDLSMCRLRGSSYIHLEYLRNMKVTSSLVIAIIVNKRLWGLYSFHGYRHPIRPSAKTRFLCEMSSVMTSIVMESLTRKNEQSSLMNIDETMSHLKELSLFALMNTPKHSKQLFEELGVDLISFRMTDEEDNSQVFTYSNSDPAVEVSADAFHCLQDTYGQVCDDYGVVFVNETKTNKALGSLHTIAFYRFQGGNGLDVLLSRKAVVELVEWGGDPEKALQDDGILSPRSSFASFVKGHLKKGKPWDDADKQKVRRFVERLEKYRSTEVFEKQSKAIECLGQERKDLIKDQKENLDFFAFMAHELRTPFHGVLGSLEAMREDPTLANNHLLNNAFMCGKNMIRILDDILLVAKGSYSLNIKEAAVDVSQFLRETVADMQYFAYMEGVSVRVRNEDTNLAPQLVSDFPRIRQVVHNLISNAIKFSQDDIHVELLERRTFPEVLTFWKTYTSIYAHHEPRLKDFAVPTLDGIDDKVSEVDKDILWMIISVIDRGIGIQADDLLKLGTAFTQLSQGCQKKFQGTGLGVTISNMILNALHGKMIVFSTPDYGSCFTFALPVKRGNRQIVEEENPFTQSKESAQLRKEQLQAEFESFTHNNGLKRTPRLLVVDDSTINRKICSRKIKQLLPAVEITECASGLRCIEEYEHDYNNIIGIFLDFHMPGMDGDEVARKIRDFEKMQVDLKRTVWIVGYTADILDESRNFLIEAGMNNVMPKPEPMHAFEEELRTMIRRAENLRK